MALLRQLSGRAGRSYLLLMIRPFSSSVSAAGGSASAAAGHPPGGSASAAASSPTGESESAGAGSEDDDSRHCYTLGEYGVLQFDRSSCVLLEEYMRKNPVFELFPSDRLIDLINPVQPYYTRPESKEWLRSSFFLPYFAKKLGFTVEKAFVDGNVGVLAGLNIMVFLELNISDGSACATPEKYPVSMSGVSNFLQDKIQEIYGMRGATLPLGLDNLLKYAAGTGIEEELIIYHPEFFSFEVLVAFYTEVFRLLIKEMPALQQTSDAFKVIQIICKILPHGQQHTLISNDIILAKWLGKNAVKASGLRGAVGLPPAGTLDMANLTPSEQKTLKMLTSKLYGTGYGGVGRLLAAPAPTANPIQVQPKMSVLVDLHRHCPTHCIELESMKRIQQLPQLNQQCLRTDPVKWQDFVLLLLHRFPGYPHTTSCAFMDSGVWPRLCLMTRMPIPSIFFGAPCKK